MEEFREILMNADFRMKEDMNFIKNAATILKFIKKLSSLSLDLFSLYKAF